MQSPCSRSPEFRGLKASTQSGAEKYHRTIPCTAGNKPLKGLRRAHVKDIIGAKAETPEAANNLLKVLRVLLDHAVDQEMIDSNPAMGVKRYRSRGEGIEAWTEDAVAQYRAETPPSIPGRA